MPSEDSCRLVPGIQRYLLLNSELLKQTLEKLSLREMVVKVGMSRRKFVARVISPDYEGREEWERQEAVWSLLLSELTEDQCEMVSFVFTDTPEEYEKFSRRSKVVD